MILPTSLFGALLLGFLAVLCWGSWANTQKMAGKWRFELYYMDFALGVALGAVVVALTLGELGQELSLRDNLLITGKRNLFFAFAAGAVYNLGLMLLAAAVSVAGMAFAFPVGLGIALVAGVIWSYVLDPTGNPFLLFGGAAVMVAAAVLTTLAYRAHAGKRDMDRAKEWKAKHRPPPRTGLTAIWLSIVCGVVMGCSYPLMEMSKQTELGLRGYAIGLLFSAGVLFSTPFYDMFFMNLPVQGKPVGVKAYFTGTVRQHMLGVAGGVVWAVGTMTFLGSSGSGVDEKGVIRSGTGYALSHGAVLVALLWGMMLWKELDTAPPQAKRLMNIVAVLLIAALALIVGPALFE